MATPTHPSEIAREVLRLFAARRIPPTPDNFRTLYHEVAGTSDDAFPLLFVRSLADRLPRDGAERARLGRQLDQALGEENPRAAEQALFAYMDQLQQEQPPAWNTLIGTLLRQWEARQLGWTTARKREALERVLGASDAATLYTRLQGLVRAWGQAPSDPEAPPATVEPGATTTDIGDAAQAPAPAEVKLIAPGESGELITALRELLVTTLETVVPAFLGEHPDLIKEATGFTVAVKSSTSAEQLQTIAKQLRKFAYRLEMTAGDTAEVRAGLLNLLRLLLENIDEIVIDDRWLHGQIEALRDIVNKPTNVRLIDDAERRLKEVIFKQSQLKHNLVQTQNTLRHMLAGFVDQLASFAESTSTYHDRIASSAGKIAAARDISEISGLLDEVMRDTRVIQDEARRSRDELQASRKHAEQAEQRIAELQQELEETSRLMRHDQLTGVLNRRGLDETFDKEAARARRRRAPLCIALLDIDNFKRLNDTFGHDTGDEALIHLTNIIRENLRPNDTVARFGGEEFIIIYAESDLEQADTALVRLQRELTKAYFLADDKKLLITFSAGVAEWHPDEDLEAILKRTDAAMYEAKRSGRNKVVQAPRQTRNTDSSDTPPLAP